MSKPIRKFGTDCQFFLNDGTINAGGKLYCYAAGTTTLVDTWATTDTTLSANANPLTLDSAGRLQAEVYINQSMKFKFTDSSLVQVGTAIDNITVVDQLWTVPTAKTSDYTTTINDNYKLFKVDATSGNVTITLVAAATAGQGAWIAIKKIDSSANTVTIDPNASETIDVGHTTKVLRTQNEGVLIVCDGTNWQVISNFWGDNLTLSSGNIIVSSGNITITSGNLILTAGNETMTAGNLTLSDGTLSVNDQDTRTATVNRPLTIGADTTGVPAAGIGTGVLFNAESADEVPSNFGAIEFCATDITAGSEDTYFDILTRVAGAALTKVWRFIATGAFKGIITHANTADRTYTFPDTNISQFLVQIVNTQTGAVASGSTAIPNDDTIPQNTEGDEYMTLAITPKSTANILYIHVVLCCTVNAAVNLGVALFQDSTASALAAAQYTTSVSGDKIAVNFTHKMTAGTTSSTTFKVRAGGASGTLTFNGAAGARLLGGVFASSITITEVSP